LFQDFSIENRKYLMESDRFLKQKQERADFRYSCEGSAREMEQSKATQQTFNNLILIKFEAISNLLSG